MALIEDNGGVSESGYSASELFAASIGRQRPIKFSKITSRTELRRPTLSDNKPKEQGQHLIVCGFKRATLELETTEDKVRPDKMEAESERPLNAQRPDTYDLPHSSDSEMVG